VTYRSMMSETTIDDVIGRYYTEERIEREIRTAGDTDGWLGYVVAEQDGSVVGAGGGGLTAPVSKTRRAGAGGSWVSPQSPA